jgi:hypothetical protein
VEWQDMTRGERDAEIIRNVFFGTLAFGAAIGFGFLLAHIVRKSLPRLTLPTSIHIVVTRPAPDYVPDSAG